MSILISTNFSIYKHSCALPSFLRNGPKETRVIRGNNIGLHMKWKYCYIWNYHMSFIVKHVNSCLCHLESPKTSVKRSMSLLTTELAYALSMLTTAKLLTSCYPMVLRRYVYNLRNALNEHNATWQVSFQRLENTGNISIRSFLCIVPRFSGIVM